MVQVSRWLRRLPEITEEVRDGKVRSYTDRSHDPVQAGTGTVT
jgi:hypothetical protein